MGDVKKRILAMSLSRDDIVRLLQERAVTHDVDVLCNLSSFKSQKRKMTFNSEDLDELFFLAKLTDIFKEMDGDSSGSIDKGEIISTMHRLGYKVTPRQGEMMLKKVDTDGNSEISLEEFTAFFRNSPLSSINALAEQWADGVSTDCGGDVGAPSLPPSGLEIWQTVVAGGCGGVTHINCSFGKS